MACKYFPTNEIKRNYSSQVLWFLGKFPSFEIVKLVYKNNLKINVKNETK